MEGAAAFIDSMQSKCGNHCHESLCLILLANDSGLPTTEHRHHAPCCSPVHVRVVGALTAMSIHALLLLSHSLFKLASLHISSIDGNLDAGVDATACLLTRLLRMIPRDTIQVCLEGRNCRCNISERYREVSLNNISKSPLAPLRSVNQEGLLLFSLHTSHNAVRSHYG